MFLNLNQFYGLCGVQYILNDLLALYYIKVWKLGHAVFKHFVNMN